MVEVREGNGMAWDINVDEAGARIHTYGVWISF